MITAVLGASAGHGALVAPMSDFSVMSAHGAIFTAGPPVVFESMGETVTKEDLGGPSVAVASGLIHNAAPDDAAALDLVRTYLTYFPSSAWSYPPDARRAAATSTRGSSPRCSTSCRATAGRVYDMRDAIDVVFDAGSTFEVQPEFGRSMVCALARLGGHPVAVIANQPRVIAGSIDVDGADKAAHFITVADSFHLPLVFFADNPGVLPGTASETARHPAQRRAHVRGADDRHRAEVRGDVPQGLRLRLDGHGHDPVRRAIGACSRFPARRWARWARPRWAGRPAPTRTRAERLRLAELQASYGSANSFGFDDLIDPRETRNVLLHSLERALFRRQAPAEPVARIGITP